MHISTDIQRITLNASCMTISGGRTKELNIFCCVTGFTSDFLSFIVVELIRFFHGALQFQVQKIRSNYKKLTTTCNIRTFSNVTQCKLFKILVILLACDEVDNCNIYASQKSFRGSSIKVRKNTVIIDHPHPRPLWAIPLPLLSPLPLCR